MTVSEFSRPQDKFEILRRITLFASCTEAQLHLVADRSRLVEYKKGELIYQEGDSAEAFYVVASGRLQVYSVTNGQKEIYTVLHNGDTFGEISLLTGETHSATIEALNDTLVLQLEKKDFDELINQIPSLVLHLSRLLSKRLRTKGQTGAVGEATVVAIYSAVRGVGRTLFAVALASTLRRETQRPVVLVDLTTPQGDSNRLLGSPKHSRLVPMAKGGLFYEETIQQEVHEHPAGFHFLYAQELTTGAEGEVVVAPLISGLTTHYSYILLDLPIDINATVLKALTQADLTYLVSDCTRENVIRTHALVRQLKEAVNYQDEQLKIVLNLMESGGERMSPAEVAHSLERSVNVVLPHVAGSGGSPVTPDEFLRLLESRASAYALAVRRMAREMGGLLVGLAFGSGAALGLAHVGVLKVLEREKIPIDIIAGSSIGAMIGALWASGKSADDLERMAMRFKDPWDIRRLFILDFSLPLVSVVIGVTAGVIVGWLTGVWAGFLFALMACIVLGLITGPLIGGPIRGIQLMARLEEDFAGKTFEETWIPIKVMASDPIAREEIVFESGSLAEAVRASVSIPGIFKPVTRMGRLCLDGGVINPVPVNVLKRAGAKRVIAINVFPTNTELAAYLKEVERKRAEWDAQLASKSLPVRMWVRLRQELARSVSPLLFDVIMRSMQSMEYQIAETACREADLVLRPSLPGSHWLEFYNPEQFIRRGEEEALRMLPAIKRLVGMTESPTRAEETSEPPSLTSLPQAGTIQP